MDDELSHGGLSLCPVVVSSTSVTVLVYNVVPAAIASLFEVLGVTALPATGSLPGTLMVADWTLTAYSVVKR